MFGNFRVSFEILSLFAAVFYLAQNIRTLGTEHAQEILLIAILFLNLILVISDLSHTKKFQISSLKAFFWFFVFLIYLFLMHITKIYDYGQLREIFFGSTSGIFLFSVLGIFVARNFSNIVTLYSSHSSYPATILIGLACFQVVFSLQILAEFWSIKREDYFLIDGRSVPWTDHQRTGNFVSIYAFILCWLAFYAAQVRKNKLVLALISIVALFGFFSLAISSQLAGSNGAFIFCLAINVLAFLFLFLTKLIHHLSKTNAFQTVAIMFFAAILFCVALLTGIAIVLEIFNWDISQLRVFGLGKMEFSFISSRVELVRDNFWLHFQLAPLFGHVEVELHTTGEGTYVHGLFFYLLTHAGLVGAGLFFMMCLTVIRSENCYYLEKQLSVANIAGRFGKLAFITVLFIGAVSHTLHWGLLWFVIGFLTTLSHISQHHRM